MTFVLGLVGNDTLWVVVDRRLSYGGSRRPRDDGVKLLQLEAQDGVAVVAYAGLGATTSKTEPSDWMGRVLRGRGGPLEGQLGALATAAENELPRFLGLIDGNAHFIVAPAFITGSPPKIYTIDNMLDPTTKQHLRRFTSWISESTGHPARIVLAGSGGIYFGGRKDKSWLRELLRLVKANDRGKVSDLCVADALAATNQTAHEALSDGSVGPRSIVSWRRRPGFKGPRTAGGHQFYSGTDREEPDRYVPTIGRGLDISALVQATVPFHQERLEAFLADKPFELDVDAMNRAVAELPWNPDDKLR